LKPPLRRSKRRLDFQNLSVCKSRDEQIAVRGKTQFGVCGFVDDAPAPGAELFENFVMGNGFTDHFQLQQLKFLHFSADI
jgi:hypothetical protein